MTLGEIIPFVRVNRKDYSRLKGFFSGVEFTRASAVIREDRDGEVYVNNIENPGIVFINTSNFSYFDGDLSLLTEKRVLKELVHRIYKHDKETRKWTLKLVSPNDEWVKAIMEASEGLSPYIMPYFSYESKDVKHKWGETLPDGFILKQMKQNDNESDEYLQNETTRLIDAAYWGKADRFFNRNGGVFLTKEGKTISHSFMFYNSGDDSYELSIATDKEFRQRGFGALTTSACMEDALKRGSIVRWVCKSKNIPSVKTAEKAGFSFVKAYNVVFINFPRDSV